MEVPTRGKTTCCIVGGGPAGVLLSYLFARRGIDVVLLESHADFAREFRGDTFHASSLEVIEQLGLMTKVEPLIRARLPELKMVTGRNRRVVMGDFRKLGTAFPYVAVISQSEFLDVIVAEAKTFPSFRVEMEANALELIEEDGRVAGIRYRQKGEVHDLKADLVVAADGRGSRMRKAGGFDLVPGEAPPMDVVWFRLPHAPDDEAFDEGVGIRIGTGGHMLVLVDRGDSWQGGLVIMKGGLKDLRDQGLESFQTVLKELLPAFLRERVATIDAWNKIALLSVQVGCVEKWSKPGLLLIGDAAHVMSPVGGVGINYAMQDAVAVHNLLGEALATGTFEDGMLEAVQKRRELPVKVMQKIQAAVQNQIIKAALKNEGAFELPLPARIIQKMPLLNRLFAWVLAYGVRTERLKA